MAGAPEHVGQSSRFDVAAMVDAMDANGVVHDLSHLSQKATDELLGRTEELVVASHSNCRQLFAPDGEHIWTKNGYNRSKTAFTYLYELRDRIQNDADRLANANSFRPPEFGSRRKS